MMRRPTRSTLTDTLLPPRRSSDLMTIIVEGEAPGITCAVGEYVKYMTRRMIAPYTSVQADEFIVRSSRFAYARMVEHAMVAVQPAVRSPFKGSKRFMRILVAKPIQQDLRISGRLVATFVNRIAHKHGRSHNPKPSKAQLNAHHPVTSAK